MLTQLHYVLYMHKYTSIHIIYTTYARHHHNVDDDNDIHVRDDV